MSRPKNLTLRECYPNTVVLIGTNDDKPNYMSAAWNAYVSFEPPLFAVFFKAMTTKKVFNVSCVPFKYSDLIHKLGQTSGANVDKVKDNGLEKNLVKGEKIDVPYLDFAYCTYECEVFQCVESGDHHYFTGKIINVIKKEEAYKNDLLVEKACLYHGSTPNTGYSSMNYMTQDAESLKEIEFKKKKHDES